jgi:hypothetical protein
MTAAPAVAGPVQMFEVHGQGRLTIAPDRSVPLLIVFGGIPVHKQQSGVYMWPMMDRIRNRYHIFVAASNLVDGNLAYHFLTKTLESQSLKPSSQILYLFSGGYNPGMQLISTKSAHAFEEILLVDIWMGGKPKQPTDAVPNFYKSLANGNSGKTSYYYTEFGANNPPVRDYIAKKLGPGRSMLVKKQGSESPMDTHMRTNTFAVADLI